SLPAPPAAGLMTTDTTCSGPVAASPGEASQPRTLISTGSPGAENGRFVAPSVPANVFVAPGIRLQPACAGEPRSAIVAASSTIAEKRRECMSDVLPLANDARAANI